MTIIKLKNISNNPYQNLTSNNNLFAFFSFCIFLQFFTKNKINDKQIEIDDNKNKNKNK